MDPHVEAVKRKLDARSNRGLQKYGCDTTRADLSLLDWLRHAQEEAMDLAIYLERVSHELSNNAEREHPRESKP
jgi:hypothetical protein